MKQSKRYCSRRARELCREFFPAGCLTSGAGAGLEIPRGVLFFRRPEGVQGASGKPRASIGMRQFCHENFPCGGLTRRLRRGAGLASLWGAHTFLSMAKEKCAKESQRHGDSRGGPPRFALFANIGVPGTAVPGSCICSGLPVANCLRQLCPLGTRSLSAQASACGSRTVGCPE